jgi:hypothetical protein
MVPVESSDVEFTAASIEAACPGIDNAKLRALGPSFDSFLTACTNGADAVTCSLDKGGIANASAEMGALAGCNHGPGGGGTEYLWICCVEFTGFRLMEISSPLIESGPWAHHRLRLRV